MLPGVLLHVIEAAHPVNLAFHLAVGGNRLGEHMDNPALLLDHLDDLAAPNSAEIMRLTTGRRIERALVEHGTNTALQHTRAEGGVVRIGIVESLLVTQSRY